MDSHKNCVGLNQIFGGETAMQNSVESPEVARLRRTLTEQRARFEAQFEDIRAQLENRLSNPTSAQANIDLSTAPIATASTHPITNSIPFADSPVVLPRTCALTCASQSSSNLRWGNQMRVPLTQEGKSL